MITIDTIIDLLSKSDKGAIDRPQYTGASDDLPYLKEWMINLATQIYGVDRSVFDTPSLTSTTILRDLVHRLVYEDSNLETYDNLFAAGLVGDYTHDVAALLRVEAWATCGEIALLLCNTYTALGYDAFMVSSINGEIGTSGPNVYDDGHVTVDVKLSDGSWIAQDSTFNFFYTDDDGNLLSFSEARELQTFSEADLHFIPVNSHTYLGLTGEDGFSSANEDYFRANYLGVLYASQTGNSIEYFYDFLNWEAAHTASQGGTYSSEAVIVAKALSVQGADLITALDTLRGTGYAGGFELIDPDTGQLIGQYITLQRDDGQYFTVERGTLRSFAGSLDQIVNAIAHGTSNLALQDQKNFLSPSILVTGRGELVNYWQFDSSFQPYADLLATRLATPAYSTDANGNVVRIDFFAQANFGQGSDRATVWHYFDSAGLEGRTDIFYRDGTHNQIDYDPANAFDWIYENWGYTADGQLKTLAAAYDSGTRAYVDYDPTNAFTWSYEAWNYDTGNKLSTLAILYDDGTRANVDYDAANAFAWNYHQTNYNTAGGLTLLIERYEDGTHTQIDYDPTNAQAWSYEVWNYTTDDKLATLAITYDDGSRINVDYDPTDAFAWNYRQTNYDAAGGLTLLIERYQDGTHTQVDYDPTNAQTWSYQVWNYSAGNELATTAIVYDDGTRINVDYDPKDAFAWNYQQTNYNASGDLTLLIERYQDGTHAQVDYDPTGAYAWSYEAWNYNANDQLESLAIAYDDGSRADIAYDPTDAFDWYYRNVFHDPSGIELTTTRWDDGTVTTDFGTQSTLASTQQIHGAFATSAGPSTASLSDTNADGHLFLSSLHDLQAIAQAY